MTTLTAPISTQFHAHGAGRSCCRCRKDLTDAASMEAGIGPICRKQDNALLANSIPANPPEALHAILGIDGATLDPITLPTFQSAVNALALNIAGTDWRKVIKQVEWILSFEANRKVALAKFTDVAKALGYLGLAALWNGEASTGLATVFINADRICVAGPRNSAARFALKQMGALFAYQLPKPDGTSTPAWHAPVEKVDAFATAVSTHYPMNVGLAESIAAAKKIVADKEAAAKAAKLAAASVTTQAPTNGGAVSKTRIEIKGKTLNVITPYNANFIADLKLAVPYSYRAWEPTQKCWKVDAQYQNAVADLIVKHYKAQPMILNMDAIEANMAEVAKHAATVSAQMQAAAQKQIAPVPVAAAIPVPPPPSVKPAQQPLPAAAPTFAKPAVLPF